MCKCDEVLLMYAVNIHAHHMKYWVPWLDKPCTRAIDWSMISLESMDQYLDLASCVQDALEEFPEDRPAAVGKVMNSLEELEWLDVTRQARKNTATPGIVLINWATHPLVKA